MCVVPSGGFEPPTTGSEDQRSIQLNYKGNLGERWDSNPQRLEPQSSALPLSYNHHINRPSSVNTSDGCVYEVRTHLVILMRDNSFPLSHAILRRVLDSNQCIVTDDGLANRSINHSGNSPLCWWMDSNHRPPPYQRGILTNWTTPTNKRTSVAQLRWPISANSSTRF